VSTATSITEFAQRFCKIRRYRLLQFLEVEGENLANQIRMCERSLHLLLKQMLNPSLQLRTVQGYTDFFKDLVQYSKINGSEQIAFEDMYPCVFDKTSTTSFDADYFFQDIWAFKKIYQSKVEHHVDVGSRVIFVGLLTAITRVTFIDIRPLEAELENLCSKKGTILSMPFQDNSLSSLSCLHVAEHIGLGRYGDSLDPLGTKKACRELARTLAIGGSLYFSVPVGKPRLCFNAHRIHSTRQIMEYFENLELVEFSGVDDKGTFRRDLNMSAFENCYTACGFFHFTKKKH
jgi:hypothetical protein